jgi:glutamine amidotransferase
MNGLNKVHAANVIRDRYRDSRPTMGICIGMQVLFADSDENGAHSGIKIWPTSVKKLHAPVLPHMGWNSVEPDSKSVLFAGIEGESFYFVHSYAARDLPGAVNTFALHGERFLAATEDGALSATQFHPEKSGQAGLALIKNWGKTL